MGKSDWKKVFDAFFDSGSVSSSAFGPLDFDVVPLALLKLARKSGKRLFVVAPTIAMAEQCMQDFSAWAALSACRLPEVDILPDGSTNERKVLSGDSPRARALHRILTNPPDVFFASAAGLLAPAPDPDAMLGTEFVLKKGDAWEPRSLAERLVSMDYDDEAEVCASGEFSRRGGIVDLFSSAEEHPVRVEFFGDVVDSLRLFHAETQLSFREVESYRVILRSGSVNALQKLVPAFEYLDRSDSLIVELLPDEVLRQLEHYGQPKDAERWREFRASHAKRTTAFFDVAGAAAADAPCAPIPCHATLKFILPELPDERQSFSILSQQLVANQIRQWQDSGVRATLLCERDSDCEGVRNWLNAHAISESASVEVRTGAAPCGVFFSELRRALLPARELFALPRRRQTPLKEKMDEPLVEQTQKFAEEAFSSGDLEPGDCAVHLNYGICIYRGTCVLESQGVRSEMIDLEFADEARLRIPIRNAHLVTRYVGAKSLKANLSRLNSSRWNRTKDEARSAARNLAFDMLKLQAARSKAVADPFPPDTPEQELFEQAFPFKETRDQLAAAADIKKDMESDKPMDRLLCGDVGFGKTELAMRAAFKCVQGGRQVAMLVPTTVLAQQHYFSFLERFAGTPVVVEQLSRFRSKSEQAAIVRRLKEGSIDIVIGTHRLVQGDVDFRNLGLLIIDEEQRFGVEHKERLKRLRSSVDVLAMTATPIPRTLYMSLSGIRDLSALVSAPVHRLPIRTVFAQYDLALIREAIARELNRGGQVYFLHNRVATIEAEAEKIRAMFPDASVAVAHGKMNQDDLEHVMTDFLEKKVDVLVCTSIVESGIDVPNANTILIDRADRFGLAALYQLRGRVGRWVRQAYAYLFLPRHGIITGNARKRVAAIRRYTHLGAGFHLAMSDLEIRGAGNILGAEQSGQINAVGFHLYCRLLQTTVSLLRGEPVRVAPEVDLAFDFMEFALSVPKGRTCACFPMKYIESERVRLHSYRRLAMLTSEKELDSFAAELRDRFGSIPPEAENLLMATRIRIAASSLGLTSISVRNKLIYMEKDKRFLRRDDMLPALTPCLTPEQKLIGVYRVVQEFRKFASA